MLFSKNIDFFSEAAGTDARRPAKISIFISHNVIYMNAYIPLLL
jgi:hypothetical protein